MAVFEYRGIQIENGKPVKGLSADVYLSTDRYRIPYRAVLRTFLGNVAVVMVGQDVGKEGN